MTNTRKSFADSPTHQNEIEKNSVSDVQHHENGIDLKHMDTHHQALARDGYELDTDELPKGYFYSSKFLGTFFGIGMNLMGSTVCSYI